MTEYVSIKQVCERYSVSRSTVYRWRDRGHIAFTKFGNTVRISVAEVEDWVASLPESGGNI
ncbi:helix-turn-helix domain-containing protein [Sphingomicrobium marinum]|uniref:helix-turn-helix domain-containing protein n=1 Tax=Sphingomicrobium marinum TaxID=1227950 RepID=UPI002240AC6A|nr:helix-turn-helix domain-containing protein [Sphingomicrobium marinum]